MSNEELNNDDGPVMKLEMSLNDINIIMGALAQMPYVQVADIIVDIREQVGPQLEALNATEQ